MSSFKINNKQLSETVKKKEKFVTKLINTFKNIDTTNISSIESLEEIVQEYAKISNSI